MSAVTASAPISTLAIAPPSPETAPVQGQLVVANMVVANMVVANPVLVNPVLGLEALPPRKDVPPGAMPLFDALADQYRVERKHGVENHAETGKTLRTELSGYNNTKLIAMNVITHEELKNVKSEIDIAAELTKIGRSDLIVKGAEINKGEQQVTDGMREKLDGEYGLKGYNYSHTEIKQHCMALNKAKDEEIAKCEVKMAEEEARTYLDNLDEQVEAHKNTIRNCKSVILQKQDRIDRLKSEMDALVSEVKALESKTAGEQTKISDAQELKVKTVDTAEGLMRLVPGIQEVQRARLQKTVWGMYHPKAMLGPEKVTKPKRKLQEGGGKQKLSKPNPNKSSLAANQVAEVAEVAEVVEVAEVAAVAAVAAVAEVAKSGLNQTAFRDRGVWKALGIEHVKTEPKIELQTIIRALLHTAKGNRLVRADHAAKDVDYDALDYSQLRDMHAKTQAAIAKRDEQQAGP